jgi:hypothetical protein
MLVSGQDREIVVVAESPERGRPRSPARSLAGFLASGVVD